MTGSYGNRVISGQAVMAPGNDNSSVAGVQVTVSGTGMTTTLGPDGRFTFAGVPDNAELHFSRATDGVDMRLPVSGASAASLHVALESSSHGHHRSSGSVPAHEVEGLITAVSSTSITIHDEHGNDVTLAITPSTIIRKGHTNVKTGDLAKGMRVHAKAAVVSDTNTALEIIVQDENTTEPPDNGGATMTANGAVTAVGSSSLTVNSEDHGSVTVNVDKNTIIRKQGVTIQLSDIKVGDEVNAMGTKVDDHTLNAIRIEVRGHTSEPPDNGGTTMTANGTVTAVGSSSLTVNSEDHGSVMVNVDKNTIIRKQGVTIQLSDIKVGDEVNAMGTKVDDHTLNAIRIEVRGESND